MTIPHGGVGGCLRSMTLDISAYTGPAQSPDALRCFPCSPHASSANTSPGRTFAYVLRPQSRGAPKVCWRRCYGEGSDAMRAGLLTKTAPIVCNQRAGHMLLGSCTAPSQCDSCSRQTCSYKHSLSLSFNSCAPSIPASIPSRSTHISRSKSTAALTAHQTHRSSYIFPVDLDVWQ